METPRTYVATPFGHNFMVPAQLHTFRLKLGLQSLFSQIRSHLHRRLKNFQWSQVQKLLDQQLRSDGVWLQELVVHIVCSVEVWLRECLLKSCPVGVWMLASIVSLVYSCPYPRLCLSPLPPPSRSEKSSSLPSIKGSSGSSSSSD